MKKIIFLILFLMPTLVKAQEKLPETLKLTKKIFVDSGNLWLNDNWKFHAGDDTIWSSKEFNDSSWINDVHPYMDAEKGKDKKIGFEGKGWFRYHFNTDSSLSHFPLTFQMEQSGASEIFLDGKLIADYGMFTQNGHHDYVNPKKSPFVLVLPDTGHHVIAVRYENFGVADRLKNSDEEMAGFKVTLSEASEGYENYFRTQLSATVICLTMGCIFFAMFVVHLILFLFYKTDTSNLYFSLFNLGIASFLITALLGIMVKGVFFEDFFSKWIYVSLSLACVAISIFVNKLFGRGKIRSRIIIALCIIEMILAFINYNYAAYVMSCIAIICALEAVILCSIAMYRRVAGARIIGTGILFFVLFFAVIIVIAFTNGSISLTGDWLSIIFVIVSVMAVFSIPFSMSAYLAWSFARVNRNLGTQLIQVEQLSRKTLQQEMEKKQLLENRKEELEEEVANRTSEVMQQKAQIEQQHELLKAEKKKSDALLLNILPAEIAEELKEKGESKAQLFDHVTVLFTDFVNFTQISEALTPQALVTELHECFRAFDDIMERNGLEKIKTIGDAYLAVSGMPVYNPKHAFNAVKAGMEIVSYIHQRKTRTGFEVRVGIHSGPLVAGIVGVKKFAYDIWGDTVNTASRMESNSEAGRINISEATHQLVEKDFTFTYRGKIDAKNKGAIDMYFVDGIIDVKL